MLDHDTGRDYHDVQDVQRCHQRQHYRPGPPLVSSPRPPHGSWLVVALGPVWSTRPISWKDVGLAAFVLKAGLPVRGTLMINDVLTQKPLTKHASLPLTPLVLGFATDSAICPSHCKYAVSHYPRSLHGPTRTQHPMIDCRPVGRDALSTNPKSVLLVSTLRHVHARPKLSLETQ